MPTCLRSVLVLALLAGCIDPKPVDDSTGTDDTGTTDSGPSIYDVNDGTVPLDTIVTLKHVVVTSPVNRDGDGFFVADEDGGPNSGLFVWKQAGMSDVEVYEGDELTITGTPTEYYGWIEFVIDSADDVEVTGEADMPGPVELGDGSGVDWEQYESVLVTLESQTIDSIDQFNTATLSGGILLDDGFFFLDFDCRGEYASVTGLVFYQYESHSLNPRDEYDLGAYTDPEPIVTTVADIEAGETCGPVTVEGVVATAPNADEDDKSTFFVQDAGGGAMSGVQVFSAGGVYPVSVGDTLTITGSVDEYYDMTQLYVEAVADLSTTGSGEPIVESLTDTPSDWEPYEGMLVTLPNVDVTSEPSYGEVETSWGIKLDTMYYEFDATIGDHYSTVTGVVNYSYSEWKLEPRDAADLVP